MQKIFSPCDANTKLKSHKKTLRHVPKGFFDSRCDRAAELSVSRDFLRRNGLEVIIAGHILQFFAVLFAGELKCFLARNFLTVFEVSVGATPARVDTDSELIPTFDGFT